MSDAPGPGDAPDLHGRPSAAELVEAVREFLERDVMAATEGRVRFHARVAANALRTVERELAEGATAGETHARRLARLGVASDTELSTLIRSGQADDRLGEVRSVVHESVVEKLRIANPDYLEGDEAGA
jgi:hypothetical protein